MMTPPVAVRDWGEELRSAIFRARLLLAMYEGTNAVSHNEEKSTVPARSTTLSVPRESIGRCYSGSLRSVHLDDESSEMSQLDGKRQQVHVDRAEEEDVIRPVSVGKALPLPPLHWQLPTLQQRLEAVEKRQERRQKRKDRTSKGSWFTRNPVAAAAVAVCGEIGDANDDYQRESSDLHHRTCTSSSSAFTLTGDRSERSGSDDTYAASHVSTDDVYIHQLARERESSLNASITVHRRWGSVSITVGGMYGSFSAIPSRPQSAIPAYMGACGDSAALTAQTEFDRIGTGEEAPYTSYLFSPQARIVDLNILSLNVNKNTADTNTVASASATVPLPTAGKDGCTRVSFSPGGDCYIVGTESGTLWFVQVTAKPGGFISTTAEAPLLLHGHSGAVTDIAFDDVGTCFASAGADACVILWSQRTPTKIRRINTDGVVPVAVRFMPKNNNYLLVSLPKLHLLRLYNSSTGFPVTRKGQVIRVEATALAMEPCSDPFLFLGDTHGAITVWRYSVSSVDAVASPTVVTEDVKESVKPQRRQSINTTPLPPKQTPSPLLESMAMAIGQSGVRAHVDHGRRREFMPSSIVEGQPQFEKIATCLVEKGTPVASLVVSSMNHQQFHCLLRAQKMGQETPEKNTVKKWAVAAFGGGWQQNKKGLSSSTKTGSKISARSAYAVMLLASFPRDRLVILSVQPSKSTPREYQLISMLVITGACRVRQMSVGSSFCLDNVRCPTLCCTCEEGFVRIIACTPARPLSFKEESTKRTSPPTTANKPVQWSVMATLPVPCGGAPRSLAWSPDMGLLVAVTEEGVLYEWRRVHLHLDVCRRSGDEPGRDDDDSTGGLRTLDEAEEWRICLRRKRERQMRRYRARGGNGDSSDSSLSGMEDLWNGSGDATSQSSGPSIP